MSSALQSAAASEAAPLLQPLTFVQPGRIEYGAGKAQRLADFIPNWAGKRVLLVADGFNAGRADILGLPQEHYVFSQVKPEPDLPNLTLLVDQAKAFAPDVIVGFGGGSAMDLAKLAAVLCDSDLSFRDIVGVDKAEPRKCMLVSIPTTAGTGSEVGARALVMDPVTKGKMAADSRHMVADIAIVDPDMTTSLPAAVTAATGVDALAHCVEAFTSRRSHPLIDLYAREGIGLVGRYLARAVADGDDVEARAGLAMAALYGGFCLGPVNTTAGHALSYPLGTRFEVPHGLANAVIFPHTLAFNAPVREEKSHLVAQLLGLPGKDIRSESYAFCEALGIEMCMSKLGVAESDLQPMAEEAHAIRRLLDFNPRDMSVEDIVTIYRAAL